MSRPDDRALRKLVAEIQADRTAVDDLADEVEQLAERSEREGDPAIHAALAFRLEQLYTAVESVLLRIATTIDGDRPDGPDWHSQLLKDMTLSIDEVRPEVLSHETARHLRKLLALRHFLRHAYAVALEPDPLHRRAEDAAAARRGFGEDLDRFLAFLRDLVAHADRS